MTLITLSTIGCQETKPLSEAGRVFNVFLVFFYPGVAAYTLNNGVRAIPEGEVRDVAGRRKMEKRIAALNGA